MSDGIRGTRLALAAVAASGLLVLTACGGESQAEDGGQDGVPDARISITPGSGAENVGINDDAAVTVKDGTLAKVTMTAVEPGEKVDGKISGNGRSWRPDDALERGTEYRVTARAEDGAGRKATSNSRFTTVSAENSVIGHFQPGIEGETVGVGMYPSIEFDKPVTDKAAVESGIEVTASSGEEVVGHWFGDQRLDLRPEDYFAPGTEVVMTMDLDGVEASPGVYGVQDRTVRYTVGSSMVSTVDVADKTLTVRKDGKVVRTLPISAGDAENPTWNGTMVVSEKHEETRMDGSTVGFVDGKGKSEYDIPDVPHALRLSTSGTFLHGNYWAGQGVFGAANTSHGCIGLFDKQGADDPGTDGAWFYDKSKVGDVVIVENSPDEQIAADNGLSGWNLDWATWKAGSAVR